MPAHGGLTPLPERYGGTGNGQGPIVKRIADSLAAQLGTAFDTTPTSNVWARIEAYARAIAGAWSDNARMANQWDARRMTDFLPRWEAIFGLSPAVTDTAVVRRARVQAALARVTIPPTYQAIYDQLTTLLGPVFVGIIHTTSANAVVWTPGGSTPWPMGSHDPAGVVNFYSNIAHILVKVTQPAGMLDTDFYSTVAQMGPVLDALLPAWVTWDWSRFLHSGAQGFYLDGDPTGSGSLANLDNESFNS